MSIYDILLLLILAVFFLFLPTLVRVLYKKIRGKLSTPNIASRYRHIEEAISQELMEESTAPSLPDEYSPESILQVFQSRILLASNLRNKDIEFLVNLGLVSKTDELIFIRREILEQIRNIERDLKNANIIYAPYDLMARRGIINIIFFEIEPSYGPKYKYATTLTEYAQRLLADRSLLTTIFVAEEDQIIDTGYSRVLIRRIQGGERGYSGIVLAEITYGSNIDEIRNILSKIDRIPASEDEASRLVSDILSMGGIEDA